MFSLEVNSIEMEFRILKGGKKTKARTAVLDFKRLQHVQGSTSVNPLDTILERDQVQKDCFWLVGYFCISQGINFLQGQEWPILLCRRTWKDGRRVCMDEQGELDWNQGRKLMKRKHTRGGHKHRWLRRNCLTLQGWVRKTKSIWSRDVKGNRKCFHNRECATAPECDWDLVKKQCCSGPSWKVLQRWVTSSRT